MLVADTNVLVRLLAKDDQPQAERARHLLEDLGKRGDSLFVPDPVFTELLWVLGSAFAFQKNDIVILLRSLLGDPRFAFQSHERLLRAVGFYGDHPVDFVEAYAAALAIELDADGVVSFDRDVRHLPVIWYEP